VAYYSEVRGRQRARHGSGGCVNGSTYKWQRGGSFEKVSDDKRYWILFYANRKLKSYLRGKYGII